jgi:hypothetical protein
MKKYVIIDAEAIQKRIEELDRLYKNSEKPSIQGTLYNQLSIELKQLLSQSTPLIPEIEKSMDSLRPYIAFDDLYEAKEDYISNLKLDL